MDIKKVNCTHIEFCALKYRETKYCLRCVLKNYDVNELPLYKMIKTQCKNFNIKY